MWVDLKRFDGRMRNFYRKQRLSDDTEVMTEQHILQAACLGYVATICWVAAQCSNRNTCTDVSMFTDFAAINFQIKTDTTPKHQISKASSVEGQFVEFYIVQWLG